MLDSEGLTMTWAAGALCCGYAADEIDTSSTAAIQRSVFDADGAIVKFTALLCP